MAITKRKSEPGQVEVREFRTLIYGHYRDNGRALPWRQTDNPYHILVSEIMLQQTQVGRVIEKYEGYLALFPDFRALASARLSEVVKAWQGLGYNRRALALKTIAQRVMDDYSGVLPSSVDELTRLPGIGRNTAAAICAFAFNEPVVFIETNIRAAYMGYFFKEQETVHDMEILPLVEVTLDKTNPRNWYNALMDYGAMLKKTRQVANSKNSGYRKQSLFTGSDRQIRGRILKALVNSPTMTEAEIVQVTGSHVERVRPILLRLAGEGFVRESQGRYSITA